MTTSTGNQRFAEWVGHEQRKRADRANRCGRQQIEGRPEDDLGRWWLERTAVLEQIAGECVQLVRREPGLTNGLAALLQRLDQVAPPTCRPGDHG